MTPPDNPIFKRLEAEFPHAKHQGWYKADIGTLSTPDEVWVMSVYDRALNTYGLRGGGYAVIADNTYFGSVAYNLFLVELGRMIAPDAFDYDQLLAGNLKLHVAEAYLTKKKQPGGEEQEDNFGRNMMLEFLFDFETQNLELLELLRTHDFGFDIDKTLASFATMQVLLHEIGHFTHPIDFGTEEREQVTKWFAEHEPTRASARLEEEAYCDLFAAISNVYEFVKQGFNVKTTAELGRWARLSVFVVLILKETINGDDDAETSDESSHELILRHRCVSDLTDMYLAEMSAPSKATIAFEFISDDTRLYRAAAIASSNACATRAAMRFSALILEAIDNRPEDVFSYILENSIQFWNAREGSDNLRT